MCCEPLTSRSQSVKDVRLRAAPRASLTPSTIGGRPPPYPSGWCVQEPPPTNKIIWGPSACGRLCLSAHHMSVLAPTHSLSLPQAQRHLGEKREVCTVARSGLSSRSHRWRADRFQPRNWEAPARNAAKPPGCNTAFAYTHAYAYAYAYGRRVGGI